MRKGAEIMATPPSARSNRELRRVRRGASVWLVTPTTRSSADASSQSPAAQPPAITGALALDEPVPATPFVGAARRCAVFVDSDSALAAALAHALEVRFRSRVRLIRDAHLLEGALLASNADVMVIDASASFDAIIAGFLALRATPDYDDTEAIFVTSGATSYQLSQLGANGGVVLRQPHCLDDIASFIGEALAGE